MIDSNDEKLGKIRITSVPNGEAPEDIKRKWIGVEIPCLCSHSAAFGSGALTKTPIGARSSFVVLQTHALEALARTAPEAVQWWNSIGYPKDETATWLFDQGCAEVLKEPLSWAKISGQVN